MSRVLLAVWLAVTALRTPAPKQQASDEPPDWLIYNVMRWLPLVHRWHADFPQLDPAWVLGLIAQESQGNPYAEASDLWGSVGLMQVGPRSWTGTREQLLNPSFNIFVGMRMLNATLEKVGDIRTALAGYNCGLKGIAGATGPEDDRCGAHGGYAYADKILELYVPIFRAELTVRAGDDDLIGTWLAELGYKEGAGRWEVIPEEIEESCIELPARRFRPRMCL